jgi:photosystem II stability/assembly factor-like uncharacterized protein
VSISVGPNLYAGTTVSGVFRSTNHGENWTAVKTGMIGQPIQALAAVGTNIYAGITGISNGGAFRSDDGGNSWTAINTGLPPGQQVSSFAVVGTKIFAATGETTFSSGVFRSTDQGDSWTASRSGIPLDTRVILSP